MENNEENRNCNMQNDCKYNVQGINAAFGYNTATALNDDLNCCNSCNKEECMQNRNRVRQEMMKQIYLVSKIIANMKYDFTGEKTSVMDLLKIKIYDLDRKKKMKIYWYEIKYFFISNYVRFN